MNVLAFDPYFQDAEPPAAKVAKPAKDEEIQQFPAAKAGDPIAKVANQPDAGLAGLAAADESLAAGDPQKIRTLATLAGLAASSPQSVNCAWCGTPSPAFALIVNSDLWLCRVCLPGNSINASIDLTQGPRTP